MYIFQTRIEAMHSLNQNMPSDCISSDHWNQIRKNLMDVMSDPEPELSVIMIWTRFVSFIACVACES